MGVGRRGREESSREKEQDVWKHQHEQRIKWGMAGGKTGSWRGGERLSAEHLYQVQYPLLGLVRDDQGRVQKVFNVCE